MGVFGYWYDPDVFEFILIYKAFGIWCININLTSFSQWNIGAFLWAWNAVNVYKIMCQGQFYYFCWIYVPKHKNHDNWKGGNSFENVGRK